MVYPLLTVPTGPFTTTTHRASEVHVVECKELGPLVVLYRVQDLGTIHNTGPEDVLVVNPSGCWFVLYSRDKFCNDIYNQSACRPHFARVRVDESIVFGIKSFIKPWCFDVYLPHGCSAHLIPRPEYPISAAVTPEVRSSQFWNILVIIVPLHR